MMPLLISLSPNGIVCKKLGLCRQQQHQTTTKKSKIINQHINQYYFSPIPPTNKKRTPQSTTHRPKTVNLPLTSLQHHPSYLFVHVQCCFQIRVTVGTVRKHIGDPVKGTETTVGASFHPNFVPQPRVSQVPAHHTGRPQRHLGVVLVRTAQLQKASLHHVIHLAGHPKPFVLSLLFFRCPYVRAQRACSKRKVCAKIENER